MPDIVGFVRKEAEDHIRLNYERHPNILEVRPYHSWWHTADVKERFGQLADAIEMACPGLISPEEKEAGDVAAYSHDVVQTCTYPEGPFGMIRKRFTGDIERSSAAWAMEKLLKIGGFSIRQKDLVCEAIVDGTTPKWDTAKNRITQPGLHPGSSLVAVLIGIADLGPSIMGGATFAKEGRTVCREDNLFILLALDEKRMRGVPDNVEMLAQQCVSYLGNQVSFMQGIADRLEEEYLPLIPAEAHNAVRSVCNKAPEARSACESVHQWAQRMQEQHDWMNIFRLMGYPV